MSTTPLINPLWFYLFEIVESLDCFFFGIATILTLLCIGAIISGSCGLYDSTEDNRKVFNFGKKLIAPIIIIAILISLLPSQETCYKMLAASYVTPANIEAVGDTAADVTTFIADTIEDIIHGEDAE